MNDVNEVHFYESKGKLVFLALMSIVFIGLLLYFSFLTFAEQDYLVGVLLLLGAAFFGLCLAMIGKKLFSKNPYLILNKQYLTIFVLPNSPVQIRWEDINDYIFYEIQRNKFIGLSLDNEEGYSKLMPEKMKRLSRINVKMGYPQYNIVFGNLKEKQRLLEELEKRTPHIKLFQAE
ncbi:hypothetical protein GCM10008967_17410 [Bacillus carboniphilus]|uniref:Uncharacterized protein n=1 Tax=Bacillus carboniphilus TaxID=86663 RepID=A0ABP3FVM1_9BACI